MPIRTVIAALAALLLVAAPAAAKSKTETAASGQVTATLSYDYKQTRFGTADFQNMRVTVERSRVRLVEKTLGPECRYCTPWPAGGANQDAPSIFVRDLDAYNQREVLGCLYTGRANCCYYSPPWRFDEAQNKYVEKVLRPG